MGWRYLPELKLELSRDGCHGAQIFFVTTPGTQTCHLLVVRRRSTGTTIGSVLAGGAAKRDGMCGRVVVVAATTANRSTRLPSQFPVPCNVPRHQYSSSWPTSSLPKDLSLPFSTLCFPTSLPASLRPYPKPYSSSSLTGWHSSMRLSASVLH